MDRTSWEAWRHRSHQDLTEARREHLAAIRSMVPPDLRVAMQVLQDAQDELAARAELEHHAEATRRAEWRHFHERAELAQQHLDTLHAGLPPLTRADFLKYGMALHRLAYRMDDLTLMQASEPPPPPIRQQLADRARRRVRALLRRRGWRSPCS